MAEEQEKTRKKSVKPLVPEGPPTWIEGPQLPPEEIARLKKKPKKKGKP